MIDYLQKIELTESERLWLDELYESYKRQEYIRPLNLKRKLLSKLDKNFNPNSIDNRLVRYGYQLTPLGILYVDPASNILEKIDHVLSGLKNYLQKNFKEDKFFIKDVLKELSISYEEFVRVLDLIKLTIPQPFQYVYEDIYSASSSNPDQKERVLKFQSDEAIEEILNYEGIEKFVEEKILPFIKQDHSKKPINPIVEVVSKPLSRPHSIFRSQIDQKNLKGCFVLMPFNTDWSKSVYESIRKNVENMGIQCSRADNDYGSIIIEDIWIQINSSAIIIADVTGRNPNVLYELGIAHALDVPTILITQEIDNRLFDTAHLRHFVYKNDITGFEFFEKELPQAVRAIYKKYHEIDPSEILTI